MQKRNWVSILLLCIYVISFSSCSLQKQIGKQAKGLLNDTSLATAHIGISIFDVGTDKYLYNYHGDKLFVPASNVKLFTLYTGLKYLQDSLVAARVAEDEGTVILQSTGDPTFLHPDFPNQPLLKFLQQKEIEVIRVYTPFASTSFGAGWSWDDFKYGYMAERDPFPMYGNIATITFRGDSIATIPPAIKPFVIGMPVKGGKWEVTRGLGGHIYNIDTTKGTTAEEKKITMAMDRGLFASRYLLDTLRNKVVNPEFYPLDPGEGMPIYSQPKDSLFKIMMHRSDNFFAEQTLLMAADALLYEMNDTRMIDTVMKTDFADVPQKPRWVDGSGLSRYNLFSPQDFVYVLNKLNKDYGMERLKVILPTAGEGTLEGYYKGYENNIFAKTGNMSNNVSLSGYATTKKNKQILFSILVNNHQTTGKAVRKQIEKFVTEVIDKY